jgi:HEAT repeat protein
MNVLVLGNNVQIVTARARRRGQARLALGMLCALLGGALASGASGARAEPLPFDETLQLGAPARAVRVRVEPGDGVASLRARGAGRTAREELGVAHPESVQTRVVSLSGGARVAIVRVQGKQTQVGALVVARRGRPEILWTGRLDAHGDPGERRRAVVEVADRTGDGVDDLIVGITHETNHICGQEDTLLFPRAVHPQSLELRPVVLRRLPEADATNQKTIKATRESPGPEGRPLLPSLHFVSASSSAGVEPDPSLLPAPRALGDGDASTVWMEGHGSPGRWEYVTARWSGGQHPIRALAITPSPADAELASKLGRPRSLWLVGDTGTRLHVTFPEDPAEHPGARYWIVPPEPLSWSCLSIVLDETIRPEGANPGSTRTALAEVAVYTDLDFGEGVDRLVRDLAGGGDGAAEAARLLGNLGPRALRKTAEAWPRLSPKGRRRAIRVFRAHAESEERARDALLRATEATAAKVRSEALDALIATGPVASKALGALAKRASPMGDQAALALGRMDSERVLPLLFEALEHEGGSDRPELRRALRRAARRAEPARVRKWAEGGPPTAAAASAALALSAVSSTRSIAHELVLEHRGAGQFADRWRLVRAAHRLDAHPEVDAWLEDMATAAGPWMLRAAAVRALHARGSQRAAPIARQAVQDDYPRVRLAAVEVLAAEGDQLEPLAIRARRDSWAFVRAAGVRALEDYPKALPVLRAALRDPAHRVRAASITTLTAARDREAWPAIHKRLRDADEWPQVLSAAIGYVRSLCIREATGALVELLDRALEPKAWEPDVEVGVEVIGALRALGGEQAEQALERARAPAAPAALQDAVRQAREQVEACDR